MCTTGHLDLKADPQRLETETTPAGVQRDRDGTILWTLVNCRACGSSLCVDVKEQES